MVVEKSSLQKKVSGRQKGIYRFRTDRLCLFKDHVGLLSSYSTRDNFDVSICRLLPQYAISECVILLSIFPHISYIQLEQGFTCVESKLFNNRYSTAICNIRICHFIVKIFPCIQYILELLMICCCASYIQTKSKTM